MVENTWLNVECNDGTWLDASSVCMADGGQLATVTSMTMNNWVSLMLYKIASSLNRIQIY